MKKTIYANEKRKRISGKDIKAILTKVEKMYPEIKNWKWYPNENTRKGNIHGDAILPSGETLHVTIQNV